MPRKPMPFNAEDLIERYLSGDSGLQVAKMACRRGIYRTFSGARSALTRTLLARALKPRDQHEAEALKWSKMTPAQRLHQTRAAHDAVRGTRRSVEDRCTRALGVQRIGRMNISESRLCDLLVQRGIDVVPQQAIGPYNCDLGAHPVAVEILGGNWHYGSPRLQGIIKRTRYILDAGWHVLMLEVSRRFPVTPEQADYVVAYIESARRNPTAVREYRMIRRAGEFVAGGRADDHEISLVPAFTSRRNPTNGRYETIPR